MYRLLLITLLLPVVYSLAGLPSEIMPKASEAPVLGLALAGDRIIAVGERGHILWSEDDGRSWQQAPVPTRSTLTAVDFADPQNGWAVGHNGTVLRSRDSGNHWESVDLPIRDDDSLLDVHFSSAEKGFMVGAYGLFLHTEDGGEHWHQEEVSEEELHLNRIRSSPEGWLFIVGEAGVLLYSESEGEFWDELDGPYLGSYFGLTIMQDGSRIIHGLRGNLFRQDAEGEVWKTVDLDTESQLMASIELADGRVVVTGSGDRYFISEDGGLSFLPWPQGVVEGSAVLIESTKGTLIAGGLNGVHRLSLPERSDGQ